MVKISYNNVWATVEAATEVHSYLWESLKYRPAGYDHVYSFKSGRWNGYNYLYKDNRFRVGLLCRVLDILHDKGIPFELVSKINRTQSVDHHLNKKFIKAYDFQQNVIPVANSNDRGIIVSPTGTGKTVIIALVIDNVKLKTIVLVNDIVLLDQMALSLSRYFDQPIGMIGDGEFQLENITVSTIQSLLSIGKSKSANNAHKKKALGKYVEEIGLIITDEAHLNDIDSVAEIMPMFPNVSKVFGFSATPYGWLEKTEKKENLELEQHLGIVVSDSRKIDFEALGLKVPLIIESVGRQPINYEYKRHFKKQYGRTIPDAPKNYKDCVDTEILQNTDYHKLIANKAWDLASSGQSVFIHTIHNLKFGEDIQNLVPGSVLVNGKTPRLERREIYEALRNKDILVLVSDIGGYGLDIPSLNAMMLASDAKDVRQLIGRVSRSHPNKQYGLIVDMNTDCMFLKKHYDIRKSQYKGYKIIGE